MFNQLKSNSTSAYSSNIFKFASQLFKLLRGLGGISRAGLAGHRSTQLPRSLSVRFGQLDFELVELGNGQKSLLVSNSLSNLAGNVS
jgi:hypothetical protein